MVVGPKVSSERKESSIQAAWNVGKWGELRPWEERDRPGDGRVRIMGQGRRSAEVGRKREGKKGGEQERVARPVRSSTPEALRPISQSSGPEFFF